MNSSLFPLSSPPQALPTRLNNPFCYEPHPLCRQAATLLQAHLEAHPELMAREQGGKMFGVLVVLTPDGTLGFTAAYSGLLSGRNDWPRFAPPVYDAQQPDGHFKQEERRISLINSRIRQMLGGASYREARLMAQRARQEADLRLEAERQAMRERKALRDKARQEGALTADVQLLLVRQSQHDKAQLRRLRLQLKARTDEAQAALQRLDDEARSLGDERRRRSEELQRWLFSQYRVGNALGQEATLLDLFAHQTHQLPPAGAGDCCAPKLLRHALLQGWRPVAMAEFWWGPDTRDGLRQRGRFYPACNGKCRHILPFMLRGLDVMPDASTQRRHAQPRIVYEDGCMAVVDKPAGMLSVPGKEEGRASVEQFVRQRYGIAPTQPVMVHRLDMDTSGLLVVARTRQAHKALQAQFLKHEVRKQYEALLERPVAEHPSAWVDWAGRIITLPLRPDPDNRPLQMADATHGRPATTRFLLGSLTAEGHQRVSLWPLTGRTHQLRVHCAHPEGLASPICADPLYGSSHHMAEGQRLCLHAAHLWLKHPMTGHPLHFSSPVPF